MSIDHDDPRLTSYALGELGAKESAEIEAVLASDPVARAEVETIRRTADLVKQELASEPAAALGAGQVDRIEAKLSKRPTVPVAAQAAASRSRGVMPWIAGACLGAVVFVLVPLFGLQYGMSSRSSVRACAGYSKEVSIPGGVARPVPEWAPAHAAGKKDTGAAPSQPLMARLPPMSDARRPVIAASPVAGPPIGVVPPGQVPQGLPVDSVPGSESYDTIAENPFLTAAQNPLSTFSIDVDTASYANVRRFIQQGMRPPRDAVRIEELVNYFPYDYASPDPGEPLTVLAEVAGCPWNDAHRLVRVGVKGRMIEATSRPRSNLVFLIDVSGSMGASNKLPLVKEGLKMLVEQLGENDTLAIAVYAGASGLVLPPTCGQDRGRILSALEELHAGGSTNGGEGLKLAYDTAVGAFVKGGNNRVILATDGDFNVGVTDRGELVRYVEEKARTGIFLTILGVGSGNFKDAMLEEISRKANGNFSYIDSTAEAKKVLVDQMVGTLITIAKDVKIQVEFNPARVGAYRLLGYENRALKAEDFKDDKKDAGELGAGHTVTALYELVPTGADHSVPGVDPLKYQANVVKTEGATSDELMTVKLRYKEPTGEKSKQLDFGLRDSGHAFAQASNEFRFAAGVAGFGMLLRQSPHKGKCTFDLVSSICREALGPDKQGYRKELVSLVERAATLPER